MTIPASELVAWSELAEKATPGPWLTGGPWPSVSVLVCVDGGCGWPEPEPPIYEPVAMVHQSQDFKTQAPQSDYDNAAFIAASRTALPRLLSAYSQSQARVAELEKAIEKHRADSRFSPHGWGFREKALWSVLPQSEGAT